MKKREQLRKLLVIVPEHLQLDPKVMTNGCIEDVSVYARHLFCFIARQLEMGTHAAIGSYINKKHSASCFGTKQIIKWQINNKSIQKDINAIKTMLLKSDSCFFFKRILQLTPLEKIPELEKQFNEWIKNIDVISEEIPSKMNES